MVSIERKLESDALLLSIEEAVVKVEKSLGLLDFGYALADTIKTRIDLNKQVISTENVNSDVLNTALEHYNKAVDDLGYKGSTFVLNQDSTSLESLTGLVKSEEDLSDDVWTAIKTLLESTWKVIEGMYKQVKKYLEIERKKVEEDDTKIDELPDLKDFDIDDKNLTNLVSKYRRLLPLYMGLGYDLTSIKDLRTYADMIKGNKDILSNKELFINGEEEDSPNALSYPSVFEPIGNASDSLFSNVKGIITKSYQSKVNSHYLTSFTTDGASVVNMFVMGKKEEGNLIKLTHVSLTLDTDAVNKNSNNNPSKLSKKFLNEIIEVRKNLLDQEDDFDKEVGKMQKYFDSEFKKMSSIEGATNSLLTGNSKAIGNVMAKTANSLVKHIKMFDKLTDDLVNLYENASKTAE